MGSACCSYGYEKVGANENGSGSDHHVSSLFNGCLQGLVNKCRTLFGGGSPIPVSDEDLESEGMHNGSSATSPVDEPLSVVQNPRCSQMSAEDVVGGQDRGSSHSCAEEPIKLTAAVQQQHEILKVESTLFNACKPEKSKERCSDFSLKGLSSVKLNGVEYLIPSSEDVDVCPTCLEEYTEENPRIVTRCLHHYHLSCIYEWMERSDTCPFCGALMEFDE